MVFLQHFWWLNKMAVEITPLVWWLVTPVVLAGIAMLSASWEKDSWERRGQSLWGLATLLFPLALVSSGVVFVASPVEWHAWIPGILFLSEVLYFVLAVWRARTCRWFTAGVALLSVAYSILAGGVASMSISDVWL